MHMFCILSKSKLRCQCVVWACCKTPYTLKLFLFVGSRWHDMRTTLSPAFTSGKMRAMFPFMIESARTFTDYYVQPGGNVELELKDSFTRYTNDVIASSAFGIKCNSLADRENEFFMLGKKAFNFEGLRSLLFFGYAISPTLMKVNTNCLQILTLFFLLYIFI